MNALYTATGAIVQGGAKAFLDNSGLDLAQVEQVLGFVGLAATIGIVYLFVQAIRQMDDSRV